MLMKAQGIQREAIQKCVQVLTGCQSRDEIIEGFDLITRILNQVNNSVADASGSALHGCKNWSDEDFIHMRDFYIKRFKEVL